MPTADRKLKVFLCHAKEDKPTVRELYRQLTAEGWMDVWLDEIKLLPGQEWDIEIEKAVEQADVVIVCLSNKSVDKEGYVQKELRFVLNIADEKPEGTIFVVPLRLDDCAVPRRIRAWQYVDYFPKSNQAWAYQRLIESLKLRAGKIGIAIEDEQLKAERELKAKEERERIATQKAEAERVALEKAEATRKAKAERDQVARQKVEERKRALAETIRKINFNRVFMIGGIIVAAFIFFFIAKSLSNNLPTSPSPTETPTIPTVTVTSQVAVTLPTSTEIQIPPTATPEQPIITPIPTLGIGSSIESDGVTMMYVPAGNFIMGYYGYDAGPAHTVYLDAYYIDKYEATNAAYQRCVYAGACNPPKHNYSNTHVSYYGNSEFGDYPVIYVDWSMAKTYCEWRGNKLPTEAQWEKAARGTDGRDLPWGDPINWDDFWKDCSSFMNYYCGGGNNTWAGDTTKVGSYEKGKSPYGLYDMAGNVSEWINDWYSHTYYQSSPSSNPLGPDTGQYRVMRGGSWYGGGFGAVTRDWNDSTNTSYSLGFRCAKSGIRKSKIGK